MERERDEELEAERLARARDAERRGDGFREMQDEQGGEQEQER